MVYGLYLERKGGGSDICMWAAVRPSMERRRVSCILESEFKIQVGVKVAKVGRDSRYIRGIFEVQKGALYK